MTVNVIKSKYNIDYCILCEGNIYAKTLVIGEAPGAQEEKQKRIFVGASGKLIRNIMYNINMEDYIFFINTIPFKPYSYRNPTIQDISNFEQINTDIINIINPSYIICFGQVSKTYVNRNINNFNNKNIIIKTTFHPAYYLYSKKPQVIQDIQYSIVCSTKYKCAKSNYTIFTHLWQ